MVSGAGAKARGEPKNGRKMSGANIRNGRLIRVGNAHPLNLLWSFREKKEFSDRPNMKAVP
jgi:hypothetical protein